jgi:hypothetical protein
MQEFLLRFFTISSTRFVTGEKACASREAPKSAEAPKPLFAVMADLYQGTGGRGGHTPASLYYSLPLVVYFTHRIKEGYGKIYTNQG